jgi:FKBP-type peptidyl-prolyl cis-trans isomerase
MKTLSKNEWIAVAVSVFVVGFFFIFGQTLISALTGEAQTPVSQGAAVQVADDTLGSGAVAQAGDLVTINYTGTFIDGTVFDSSVARKEPYQFTLGSAQTIPGLSQGIAGMRVGGKRTVIIPPSLGYGASDYGPIPGNSTLVFDVELLKVEKQ